ncbi:MAG: S41 family peptidase [Bacilli bacterium]|nr:S41 family peptidase [Bacilli bacterium]
MNKDKKNKVTSYLEKNSESAKDCASAYDQGRATQKKASNKVILVTCIASLVVGTGLGIGGYSIYASTHPKPSDLTQEIYDELVNNWLYAGTIDDLEDYLNNLMISGMLDNDGDPYTFYTSSYDEQGLNTSGSGIYGVSLSNYGVEVSGERTYGGLRVTSLYDGTFKNAGFKVGDVIIGVKHSLQDTYSLIEDMSPSDASAALKPQKEDENVFFEYVRNGVIGEISCTTGDYIQVPASLEFDGDVEGKRTVAIRVSTFLGGQESGTPSKLCENIIDHCLQEDEIDRLVFDMRGNGGGYTSEAYDLACLFLNKGSIVYQTGDYDGNIDTTYYQKGNPKYNFDDIRILLNSGSASATELFSKAMRDNNKAKIYGETSFGKGIAQSVINLKNGGTLRITTNKIFGPDGTSIHQIGITPDYITNDYDKYASSLVSTPYQEDKYRLTYDQEQMVKNDLSMIDSSYESIDSYLDKLKTFQGEESLDVSGVYDTYTLYRTYFRLLSKYYAGYDNELKIVEGK